MADTFTSWFMTLICQGCRNQHIASRRNRDAVYLLMWKRTLSHFRCSCSKVVFPVKVVFIRLWPPRQQDVHIQIVIWLFFTDPVLCYCLVHCHCGLGRKMISDQSFVARARLTSSVDQYMRILRCLLYLSWPIASILSDLFVEPSDNWSCFIKGL